jgi:hypothetical protein
LQKKKTESKIRANRLCPFGLGGLSPKILLYLFYFTNNFFSLINHFLKMAKVSMPSNSSEIKETHDKFMTRYKNDPKDSTIHGMIDQVGLVPRLEVAFPKWLDADTGYNEAMEAARVFKVQKDNIMNDDLRPVMLEIKNIVTLGNKKNPSLNNGWGFPTTLNPTKKAPTEKSVENDLKRVEAKANLVNETKAMLKAMKEAKANAQQTLATASLTVSEVTKSSRVVVG